MMSTPRPTLTYFNNRGYGERVRMALCAAGVEFKEVHHRTRDEFLELRDTKKSLLFGQVPLLEIEGKNLVQSRALLNYIGRKYNLYGKDSEEATKIDMMAEGARDLYEPFVGINFTATEEEIVSSFRKKEFPKYMPIFEKVLSDSGKQYLVGDSLSLADLALLETLLSVEDFMGAESFDEYPKIKGYYNYAKNLPTMQNYLKNYRKAKTTVACANEIMTTLAL